MYEGTEIKSGLRTFGLGVALAFGGQLLIGFVVSVIQVCSLLMGFHATSIGGVAAVLSLIIGIPFNAGGFTVRVAFEALVGPLEFLVGNRTTTVMSNLPLYLSLLVLQMAFVAVVVAARYRRKKTMRDWIFIAVGILLLLNGLANIMWPWWGS